MKHHFVIVYICNLLFFLFIPIVCAASAANVKMYTERVENKAENGTVILPYALSTEDMGLVFGIGSITTGFHQKQLSVGGTVFTGESKAVMLGLWDYRLFNSKRWFLSFEAMAGEYPLLRAYASDPRSPASNEDFRPGSNNSHVDDYFESAGINNWWEVKLEYVLPIGNAVEQAMSTYHLEGGLLKSPKDISEWNPLKTGTTVFVSRQFNRYQEYIIEGENIGGAVNALELGILYDNTDFPVNPSQGSSQYLAFTHNPNWLQSKEDWTFIEFEASKYIDFGQGSHTKQRILALNIWGGYSPTWEVDHDSNGNSIIINHPPFLEGATLGGAHRMRGYAQNRFHDKAAIYTTAEYRTTLNYNPIENIRWLNSLELDWFQTVLFIEAGRVAPSFNSNVLFNNWKTDVGFSLRALTGGVIVRLDVTKSAEGTNVWAMIGHPF